MPRPSGRRTGRRRSGRPERPVSGGAGRHDARLAARRDLDDVAVGVAQVDRAEAAAVEDVGALDPARAQVVAPGLLLLGRARRRTRSGGSSRRRPCPGSSGTRGTRRASPARRRRVAEPEVARVRVVVVGALADEREPEQVAVEGGRALEVAADRGHVVQPGQPHARAARLTPSDAQTLLPCRCERSPRSARKADEPHDQRATTQHGDSCGSGGEHSDARRRRRPRRRAGQQRRVRAVAGEVLADGQLERRERRRARAAATSSAAAASPLGRRTPTTMSTSPARIAQLDERERRPRRLGAPRRARARVAGRGGGPRAAARAAAAGAATLGRRHGALAAAAAHRGDQDVRWLTGQPEESLTCHQPISMPMSPRRGRTW